MTPEERHAARLIKDMGLKPPIDIKALLSEFADIEYDRLPAGVDAVLLRKQIKKNRPLVVVDRSKPAKRQRFTLAHEFGHILIPWHIGTISCHTSLTGAFGEYLYRETESEANRFASELLMPVGWMKQIIEKHESIADIFREVRQADVSGISAGISLCKVLPSGFVFVAADNNNKILARAKSANTAARLMDREGRFDKSFYQGTGAKPVLWTSGGTTIYWWDFTDHDGPSDSADVRTSSEVLEGILQNTISVADQSEVRRRVNGIIGFANGRHKPSSVNELFSVLLQRFVGRDPLVMLCASHLDFEQFLRRRAEEIIAKKNAQ